MKRNEEQDRPCFQIRRTFGNGYWDTEIKLMLERGGYQDHYIEIHWQSNRDSQLALYGQRVKIHFDTFHEYTELTKLFRQLFAKIEAESRYFNEFTILEALIANRKRLDQVVHDSREHDYIRIGEVKPPEFKRWLDDYRRSGYSNYGCCVACMAPNEDEARRLLTVKFADCLSSESRGKRFEQWLAAGRPVMQDDYGREAPEIITAQQLLNDIIADKDKREREQQAKWAAERKAEEEAAKQQETETTEQPTEGVTA